MSFSNYGENLVLNHIFSKGVFPQVALSVALCKADPGEGGTGSACNEVAHQYGYERVLTSGASWNTSSVGVITNAVALVFPEALESWGTVTHFAILDSSVYGGGHLLMGGGLTQAWAITRSSRPRFGPGTLSLSLN